MVLEWCTVFIPWIGIFPEILPLTLSRVTAHAQDHGMVTHGEGIRFSKSISKHCVSGSLRQETTFRLS